ncbi:MAG: L,D-transpeptidase family protein [bacterium]
MRITHIKVSFIVVLLVTTVIGASIITVSILAVSKIHNPVSFLFPEIPPRRLTKTIPDIKTEIDRMIGGKESFIHVDLKGMEITLYEKGGAENKLPILRRGNPDNWGGTPLGKYSAVTKNLSSFSNSAQVYMPKAINFYGRYFIHGEPYYPSGKKLITNFSGGCVQLLDKNATTVYNFTKIGMPVVVTDNSADNPPEYVSKNRIPLPIIKAEAYLVGDLDSGLIITSKNIDKQLPTASLTKLMTAVIISENADLESRVIVTKEALKMSGITSGLDAGKKFRILEMFYPLMVESSNDAAEVIASYLGREKTITLMNNKASYLLMSKTKFIDPSGLDLDNVSSVEDMYRLIRYVADVRPPLLAITKGERKTVFGVNPFPTLKNKNIFYDNSEFVGGKAGYLPEAGYGGSFIFELKDGNIDRRIVIVILGAKNYLGGRDSLREETEAIIEWLKERYLATTI